MKMLSDSQKSKDNPLFEATVENAPTYDPVLMGMPGVSPEATATIGFYDPCHVRYTRLPGNGREVYVVLYMSPTAPGKSRVILVNAFKMPQPDKPPSKTVAQRIKNTLGWVPTHNHLDDMIRSAIEFERTLAP